MTLGERARTVVVEARLAGLWNVVTAAAFLVAVAELELADASAALQMVAEHEETLWLTLNQGGVVNG